MPLGELGESDTLTFFGSTSSQSLYLPVPLGLFPTSLNVTVDRPFNVRSATLTVRYDDRIVGRVALPPTDFATLVIPLDGVEVVDESVSLDVTLTIIPEDGYCLDRDHEIKLFNGSITYAGTEFAPTTVADFLPPILRALTIGVPATPSEEESEAAVQLAAALTASYRRQSPQVNLVPLPDGATSFGGPAQPMERRIIIREGPDEGLSLIGGGMPDLLISGPAHRLTNHARLLTHGSLNMAVTATVIPGDVPFPKTSLPGDSTTLAELDRPSYSAVGWAPQVGIGLDQTRFGHPTQGYRVGLKGTYTPLPEGFGSQMTASVGGEVIDSWPTEAVGIIDHWVDIPDRLVQRYTNLVVGVAASGNTGGCNYFSPIDLTIDGSTVVESTVAQPPIPTGFQSLPQALMPITKVGIGETNFADTSRATQIVVGLQRLSLVPLSIDLTSLEEAIDGDDSAVLISADGWPDASISLPVSAENASVDLADPDSGDEETTLTLEPEIKFGSLQTVFDGKRSLLIATSNGAAEQLDELLRWLAGEPERWSALRGNAVVAVVGREPELVPGRTSFSVEGPPTSAVAQEASGNDDGVSPWLAAVGVGAVIAIGILVFKVGARRSRSGSGKSSVDDGGDS